MKAEVGSFQFQNNKYDVMIKIVNDNDEVIYWGQRVVREFDINNCDDLLESVKTEAQEYLDSLGVIE